MDIQPLYTEDDYRAALAEVSALVDLDPARGTPEGDRLERLANLVEQYENSIGTTARLEQPISQQRAINTRCRQRINQQGRSEQLLLDAAGVHTAEVIASRGNSVKT